jgi:hypothetical protein
MRRLALYLLLLVVPILMVLTTLRIGAAMGPSWVGMNHDPGLQYVLNSLNFATLRPVGHTVHPGTPVQLAGAAILRVVHLVAAPSGVDLQSHVLANPDLYLRSIQLTFLFLQSLALVILGAATLTASKDICLALIVQLAPFYPHVTSSFLFGTTQLRPDSFLFLGSLLLAAGVVLYTQRAAELQDQGSLETADQHHVLQRRAAVYFGLLCGFAMAAKVGFLPLLLIPLVVLQGNRYRLRYVLATAATFVFLTLPILAEYPRMMSWIASLAIHTGVHGQGGTTIIEPDVFLANLKTFLSVEILFSSILAIAIVVLTAGYVVPRFRKVSAGHSYFRSLLGVACAQVAGLAIVSKHSQGWQTYYLMPVSVLTGLTLMLSVCCVVLLVSNRRVLRGGRAPGEGWTAGHLLLPVSSAIVLVGLIALTYDLRWTEISEVNTGQSMARDQRIHVHEILNRDYADYTKIFYLGSSAPAFALFFSNSEAKFYYSTALEKQFPDVYFYNPLTSQLYDWYNKVTPFEAIRNSRGDRVVFQGPSFAELQADVAPGLTEPGSFKAPPIPLTEVMPTGVENEFFRQRRETIYVFRPEGREPAALGLAHNGPPR